MNHPARLRFPPGDREPAPASHGRCRVWLVAAALAVGLGLIACGGDAGSEQSGGLPDLEFMRFPDPATSPYCLPFPTGVTATVSQSWSEVGSHRGRFAYDFALPFGAEVAAARDGTVTEIRDDYSDSDRTGGHENGLFVVHADGTMAVYLHFQEAGVAVDVGDEVETGDILGRVGTSGTAVPHLHFEVWEGQGERSQWYRSLPVSFRDATAPLDAWGGLVRLSYTAGDC